MGRLKFHLEYLLNTTSDEHVWESIGTPSGLQSWFADRVECRARLWTFTWGKDEVRTAEETGMRVGSYIRFRWVDAENRREYFELRLVADELTGDRVLTIVDFADEDELDDAKSLWHHEIGELRRLSGF